MLESRFQLVSSALPSLILFVDRDGHCRFHNLAVENKTRLPDRCITGRLLREVVGNAAYAGIAPHLDDTLAGKEVEYEIIWETPGVEDVAYSVRHIPYPPQNAQPIGFYLLATAVILGSASIPEVAGSPASRKAAGKPGGPMEDGDSLFIKSSSDELTRWDDPRADLVHALENDRFQLFAQKILPLKGDFRGISCYEILLHLKEEEENLQPPGNFIPIAERYGLMEQIDRWVVRNLIAWCLEQRKQDPSWRSPLFCANLSESAVISQAFSHFLLEELRRTGFDARSLYFEIAEQDVIHRNSEVHRFIAALRPAGCRFAVDAFGGVKVSFASLRNLPVDFVKIDDTIIQNLLRGATALASVRGINTVCQKAGIRTIAKCVETGDALHKLREIGVDFVQGFGIARPEPVAGIARRHFPGHKPQQAG